MLLTVLYVFAGFGLLVTLLTLFANALIQSVRDACVKLHEQLKHSHEKPASSTNAANQSGTTEPPVAQKEELP